MRAAHCNDVARQVRGLCAAAVVALAFALPSATVASGRDLAPPDATAARFAQRIDLIRAKDHAARLAIALEGNFQPRSDNRPWPLTLPIDWNADPFRDPNWRFQLHAWRMLDPLIVEYVRDSQPQLLDRMLALAADWKRYHIDLAHHSDFADYDMALGLRAQRIAWLWVAFTAAGRHAERDAILLPLAAQAHASLLQQRPFADTNHGLFQVHGLLALAASGALGDAADAARQAALSEFERLLAQQFSPDGGHVEHSPAYHFFALRTFRRMLASGWYAGAPTANAVLQRAADAAVWLSDPAGNVFAIGDSDSTPAPRQPAPSAPCLLRTDDGCHVMRAFPDTGWAIARSDWSLPAAAGSALILQASHHSSTHKHADDLSFVWFDRGKPVLIDPGRFGYVENPLRDYMASTRAHNTVQVDRRNQATGGTAAYGSALTVAEVRDGHFVFAGRVADIGGGVTHERALLYTPSRALLVIDRLTSASTHEYTHWFQFDETASWHPAAQGTSAPDVVAFADGRTLHVLPSRTDCGLEAFRGATAPRLQGWVTAGYAKAQPSLSLALHCSAPAGVHLLGVAFVWQNADFDRARADLAAALAAGTRGTFPFSSVPPQERPR